jgi:hypothetical protein
MKIIIDNIEMFKKILGQGRFHNIYITKELFHQLELLCSKDKEHLKDELFWRKVNLRLPKEEVQNENNNK